MKIVAHNKNRRIYALILPHHTCLKLRSSDTIPIRHGTLSHSERTTRARHRRLAFLRPPPSRRDSVPHPGSPRDVDGLAALVLPCAGAGRTAENGAPH